MAGAHALGAVTAARWAIRRCRPAQVGAVENSTATYVRASERSTTIVWIHDYWTDAYGTDGMVIDASLVRADSTIVASWTVRLEPRSTARIDVRDACRAGGAPLPFEGHIDLRASSAALVAERPLQVIADYIDDDGSASGVHGQYGVMARPLAQSIGSMRVTASSAARSGIVITHTYETGRVVRPNVTVYNAEGASLSTTLPQLAPRQTARVYLDEAIPGLGNFLNGAEGHVTVAMPYPASRLLSFVEHDDGVFVVNHGTVDRTADQLSECPSEWAASSAVATVPLEIGGYEVVVFVPNRIGRRAIAHQLSLEFHDRHGGICGSTTVEVARNGTASIALREEARRSGFPTAAHVLISAVPTERRADRPALIEVVVQLRRNGRVVAEALAGGGFFNDPVPAELPWPDVRRTRIFTRAQFGSDHETTLVLSNPSSRRDYATVARPVVRVLALDGTEVGSFVMTIEPNGCAVVDVAGSLGHRLEALGDSGEAVVTVRDVGARLYGYCLIARPGATAVRLDHMIGG